MTEPMSEITEDEKLQLEMLELLREPKSVRDLLMAPELEGVDPQAIGRNLWLIHTSLRIKAFVQTLDGLFTAVQLDQQKLARQLDVHEEKSDEDTYWFQLEPMM